MLPKQLSLTDGTIVKQCPTDKPLYCSKQGRFYSLHNAILTDDGWMLSEIKPNHTPNAPSLKDGRCHSNYPIMRQFGKQLCHKLMALTWIGPRPFYQAQDGRKLPMEIDHLNGDIRDWSLDNLQYVTPAENRKRAKLLRILRSIGRDPRKMTRDELLSFFSHYDFGNPDARMEYEMTHHTEC